MRCRSVGCGVTGPGCCRQCTNTDKSYAESHLRCAIACAVKAAAPDDVMNYAWRFGYLGRRYRNRKTVHIEVKRAARAISWFSYPNTQHHRKVLSARQSDLPQARTADSSSTNAVSFSSACTTKRFPSPRCASAIQIVRPLESIAETRSQPPTARDAGIAPEDAYACAKMNTRIRENRRPLVCEVSY